jgi:hypothetical protein
LVIVTIDIRRGITDLDDALLHWLGPLGLRVGLLLTNTAWGRSNLAAVDGRDVERAAGGGYR